MKKVLFQTDQNWASFFIRLGLGIVLFPHGAQKLLGWFGGYGFKATMNYLTRDVGLLWLIALLVILIESIGSLLILAGFTTRVTALLIGIQFIGIILTNHIDNGFFMNWEGTQAGEGFEYHLLVIAMSLVLLMQGGGRYSLDRRIGTKDAVGETTHKVDSPRQAVKYS
ncbi:DoxX family protein [Rhodocytophaga aerolata]|uniref:DoxX family protein n=1 Tax=Rhodocytophaga aerolata TaxID=455078 RepID=A0ABT8RDS6_9BACT|nr:DoxX family protein [Rhodocytophaga aerolata]MDO1450257.1 DoxX family protein [Rhodocytophaga aerolata]